MRGGRERERERDRERERERERAPSTQTQKKLHIDEPRINIVRHLTRQNTPQKKIDEEWNNHDLFLALTAKRQSKYRAGLH